MPIHFCYFIWRGKGREQVLQALRGFDVDETIAKEPELESLDVVTFWESTDIPLIRQMPTVLPEPLSLKQLGDPPGNMRGEWREVYKLTSEQAQRWLGLAD